MFCAPGFLSQNRPLKPETARPIDTHHSLSPRNSTAPASNIYQRPTAMVGRGHKPFQHRSSYPNSPLLGLADWRPHTSAHACTTSIATTPLLPLSMHGIKTKRRYHTGAVVLTGRQRRGRHPTLRFGGWQGCARRRSGPFSARRTSSIPPPPVQPRSHRYQRREKGR